MANFKEISPDAPVAEKLLNWVDTVSYTHLTLPTKA